MTRIFFIFLIIVQSAWADGPLIDRILKKDNLTKIAKRNLGRVWIKYGKDYNAYALDIKKWNPKIKDWNNPPVNQAIYVDFPYDPMLSGSTYTKELSRLEEDQGEPRVHASVFFASSLGRYTETSDGTTIGSSQNMPLTFGVGTTFLVTSDKTNTIDSSLYYGQLSAGKITGDASGSNISTPGEYGGNIYYQKHILDRLQGFYAGYDIEKINSFNTNELESGVEIRSISYLTHYATLGMNQGFYLFDYRHNLKASVSLALASKLSGQKYIFYYTLKTTEKTSISAFFKHHQFSDKSEIGINRFGLGLSYSLF